MIKSPLGILYKMKKGLIILSITACVVMLVACSDIKEEPGRVYMPDMAYSRAFESYMNLDTAKFTEARWNGTDNHKIFYNRMPVPGTVARGEGYIYHIAKDKIGDTTNYFASRSTVNPVTSLTKEQLDETERLYNIQCGVCHGTKLDGNGPLWKDGNGPFPSSPKNLITYIIPEGQMFYSITYGKNLMGAYAAQLTPEQRWNVIYYIKQKQKPVVTAAADSTGK